MQKILFPLTFFIVVFILFFEGCSVSGRFSESRRRSTVNKGYKIRVLLAEKDNSLSFNLENSVSISNNHKIIAIIRQGNKIHLRSAGGSLFLKSGSQEFNSKYFKLTPVKNNYIVFDHRKYPGIITLYKVGDNIKIVNTLRIEEYLKGVLPAEMPFNNPGSFAALKAFAICARTYAFMKIREHKSLFDIFPDTRDQVYVGTTNESLLADRAIEQTRGMILTYRNEPAIVFYHSSCGGHTEKASNVFDVPDLPYLRGVKDGNPPNCSIAPDFNWRETYTSNIFIGRLIEAGLLNKGKYSLVSVKVLNRFISGRVNNLEIIVKNSLNKLRTIVIHGNNIRTIIRSSDNRSILKSTMFTIKINANNKVIINGKGNGHGVGLCQWGAVNLSRKGKSYRDILQFYFPGTRIERYYD